MPLLFAFILFVASMVFCLGAGYSILFAMIVGLVAFTIAGHLNSFSYKELTGMAILGVRESFIVLKIMILIGFLTAVWRSSGTITFFVYYGTSIITPALFILISFLLCCFLSYILGTSFGVAGTLGVILMVLARSGNVNESMVAGAVISGIYFGDRNSPVSSSAILVASITQTNIYENVKLMFRTSGIPLILVTAIYAVLSILNPLKTIDTNVLHALHTDFNLSLWTVIPAVFMLILPLFRMNIVWVFITSILSGFLITITVQGITVTDTLKYCILGYQSENFNLGFILNGGGVISMLTVCGVVLLSSAYSGIFKGTDMLAVIQEKLDVLIVKIGRFGSMLITSTLVTCVFCNQTIASMMSRDLLAKPYENSGGTNLELAVDIENSSIVLCGLIPWAISCSVPLQMLGAGYSALLFACLLYIIPLCYIFTKKFHFNR
ncbi:Na+/H+ antiporter NhaC family protein [Aminipila terrae]|uniref:Sodium:proton antiporter n=1 Tax=Aminipila terrae TaxID=2697030 RepID=A0A6P1MJK6_9FIRM|nr:Na+/H+ antiporter NhaC family protein [Aminipila terrae]QHI71185.1 sodium:proton antiporter [Aminipila terrae]